MSTQRKVHRFRMRPTKAQEPILVRLAGARRWVWNWALRRWKDHHEATGKSIGLKQLSDELTALKQQSETAWLKDADSQSLQQALKDLHRAFVNFFEKRTRYPRFKSRKRDPLRFRIPQRVKIADGKVYVPKVGQVRIRQSKPVTETTKSATFRRAADGHWYVSLVVEFEMPDVALSPIDPAKVVGIDLGLKDFAVLSDGERIPAPKFFCEGQKKLAKAQRVASRRKPGSNRKAKAKSRVARIHQRISNQRGDFLHKLTTDLVRDHDGLCIEDLSLKGMAKGSATDTTSSDHVGNRLAANAEFPGQIRNPFPGDIADANFFPLSRCQLAAFLRRQRDIGICPAFIAMERPSQKFQDAALRQPVRPAECRRIPEFIGFAVGRYEAARAIVPPDGHAMQRPGFVCLELLLGLLADLVSCRSGEFNALIGRCCRPDVKESDVVGSEPVDNFLFHPVATARVILQEMNPEEERAFSVFVPRRLQVGIAMLALPQLTSVLIEPLWNIYALADISCVVRRTDDGVDASFHALIIPDSTKLAKSVHDASMGEFRRQVEYKCLWNRKHLAVIDRWFPSSKLHGDCGEINGHLTLSDRTWICGCGATIDRDLNAAANIKDEGLRMLAVGHTESLNARGARVRLATASNGC